MWQEKFFNSPALLSIAMLKWKPFTKVWTYLFTVGWLLNRKSSLFSSRSLASFIWCRGHKFGLVSPCDPSWFVTSGLYISGLNLISRSFQCEFSWFLNYYSLRETVFSNISSTLLLVDFMLVASGGVLIFRKDFIAIYLIYIVNNSKRFYHVRS